MTVPPLYEPPRGPGPPGGDLDILARIEGLMGEEDALLLIPARERSKEQHERLGAIGEELDRALDALRRRAERIAGHKPAPEKS
jgi:hypothetical protein